MPKQYLFHDQINYPDLIYSLYQEKIHRETRSNIVHLFKKIKFKINKKHECQTKWYSFPRRFSCALAHQFAIPLARIPCKPRVTLSMETCQQFSWSSAKMFIFSRRRKTSRWQACKIHQRHFSKRGAKQAWMDVSYLCKNRGQSRVEMIGKELNFLRFRKKFSFSILG